jgi:protoporphyrinogen oxidase
MLGTLLALRYRQAGRLVTVFEATDRIERRGHASIASRDRGLLSLLDELELADAVRWDGFRGPGVRFGLLEGGRGRIIEALRDRARALDVDFRLGTPVHSVSTDMSGFGVDSGSEIGEFDEVVLTVPSPVASGILSVLPDHERLELLDVDYVGMIDVSFVVKKPLGGRYLSQIVRGRDRFALVDPSAVMAPPDGNAVVHVTRPVATNAEFFATDDRAVIEDFARALPGTAEIVRARVMRSPYAFARRSLPRFTTSIPGFSIVNAAHMGGGHHYSERTAALATTVFRTLCAEPIS